MKKKKVKKKPKTKKVSKSKKKKKVIKKSIKPKTKKTKQDTPSSTKNKKRIFRVDFGRYGGEVTVGRVSPEFVKYFLDKDEGDLIEYLQNLEWNDPENPVDPNIPKPVENFHAWNECDDILHENNCYSDGGVYVAEVQGEGLELWNDGISDNAGEEKQIEAYHLKDREAYFDRFESQDELAKALEANKDNPDYVPVLSYHPSEKGIIGYYFVETDGEDFDPKKLAYSTVETTLTSLIDRVWYDKKELDHNMDYASTTGKSNSAAVGYMNLKWLDQDTPEALKEAWESYDDHLKS